MVVKTRCLRHLNTLYVVLVWNTVFRQKKTKKPFEWERKLAHVDLVSILTFKNYKFCAAKLYGLLSKEDDGSGSSDGRLILNDVMVYCYKAVR